MSDNNTQNTGTGRPKRTIRPPQPIYVPDENIRLDDDESVDSNWDESSDGASIRTDDEEEELDDSDDEDHEPKSKRARKDEYDMEDGFVVPDDEEEEELDDSDDEEELDSDDCVTSEDDEYSEEEELDSKDAPEEDVIAPSSD